MIGPTNALTVTGTVDPGSVTVGSNLKPIKLVNGVATAVDNDLVSTTGDQNIAGAKTFSYAPKLTSPTTAMTCQMERKIPDPVSGNGYQYADYLDGAGNRIGVIGSRILSNPNGLTTIERGVYMQGGNQGSLYANTNGSVFTGGVRNQRAYNSSNTEDIVTIGTLQASTDVVHRSGDETIAGLKTYTTPQRTITIVNSQSGNHYYIIAKLNNVSATRYYGITFIATRNGTITMGGVAGQIYSGGNTCSVVVNSNNSTLTQMALGIGTYEGSTYLIAKATRQITAFITYMSAVSGTQDNADTILGVISPSEISAPSDYLEGGFIL